MTSEYASSPRLAMKNATDSASEMQSAMLKRLYNRKLGRRSITKELLEIVGGAEAVSG